jgi:hypothetical protein
MNNPEYEDWITTLDVRLFYRPYLVQYLASGSTLVTQIDDAIL